MFDGAAASLPFWESFLGGYWKQVHFSSTRAVSVFFCKSNWGRGLAEGCVLNFE
jgi:hypothetical protein